LAKAKLPRWSSTTSLPTGTWCFFPKMPKMPFCSRSRTLASAALREVESGNHEQARAEAKAALKLAPNRDVRETAALALARAGDTAGAEKLATELDKAFPLSTLVQRYWLPTIRAGVALER